jgi:UDPglucose 6-dehydrogenase
MKTADKDIEISIIGSGYVGMSLAALLSKNNPVKIYDIDNDRVNKINNSISPIKDNDIQNYLENFDLNLIATNDKDYAYRSCDYAIIATPTNYDAKTGFFDTQSVDSVIEDILNLNPSAIVIIKSTIPIGHTKYLRDKFDTDNIIFSPEFLREGKALHDNLYPSRIIVGSNCQQARDFAKLLLDSSIKKDAKIFHMSANEAESVKLFANTYLAMRVSFFNELDSFALKNDLNTKNIIDGLSSDSRINQGYNNPSFGYGGYCLPKDTKQLLANFETTPQNLIEAIVKSNSTRKDFIAQQIIAKNPKTVGFYKLAMKKNSDNFRSSSIQGIISRIAEKNINILIHDPLIANNSYMNLPVDNNFKSFARQSDIIVTNRLDSALDTEIDKVFTRDIYCMD